MEHETNLYENDSQAKNSISQKRFALSEAMLTQKQFQKSKDDIKKLKQIVTDLQIYVKEHQFTISQKLVNDDKLKITVELLESTMDERLKRELEKLHDRLRPKIKKRIKMEHIEGKLVAKTNVVEFNKQVTRLDDKMTLLADRVEYKMPAMEYEFDRALKNKAELDVVEKLVEEKVDKEFVLKLIDRINNISEELAAQKTQAKVVVKDETSEEEEEEPIGELVESNSPRSPKKKNRADDGESDLGHGRTSEMRKKAEEAQKHLREMVEKLHTQLNEGMDEMRKSLDDQTFNVKRIEQEVETIKLAQQESLKEHVQEEEAGHGAISGKQEATNRRFKKQFEEINQKVEKLQRIDFRLNKELVQKPYTYIDKLKAEIDKEQQNIVKIVKDNNDKYLTKIGQIDHKVNQVLTDTETLMDQYRKKIGDIGKNLESTKKFREKIESSINGFQKQIDKVATNCDGNHEKFTSHLDRISLKFAENTVDLTACSEGFQREIERVQLLFRELQQEFLVSLEEKRIHNETLLRGAGIPEKDLKKANDLAKLASNRGLQLLLPKIKHTHINENLQLTGRQDKIMALLKADKIRPEMNSPPGATSQRRFFKSPSMKSQIIGMGADLDPVNSQNFMPATQAFMTQQESLKSGKRALQGRKASHAPPAERSLPQLDYVSRQTELNQAGRYIKGHKSTLNSVKNIDVQKKLSLTLDPSIAQVGTGNEPDFGEDLFTKLQLEGSESAGK